MINGNMVGASMLTPKSLILEDENGNSFVGVTVGEETVFDATPADVRINKTFASDDGVQVGENTITYRTAYCNALVKPGSPYSIPLSDYDQYDYTKLQCVVVLKNTKLSDSFGAEKVVIDDGVYLVGSTEKLATVTKNDVTKSIELNLTNNTDSSQYIRCFTYKEEA